MTLNGIKGVYEESLRGMPIFAVAVP